jgi:hypothetical protein
MQSKAAVLAVTAVSAAGDATNPIAKVLQMIDDLAAKVIAEGEASHKVYSEFEKFCVDRHDQITPEIKTGSDEIAALQAAIGEANAKITTAASQIEELAASIAQDEKDLKEATAIRSNEHADFVNVERDLATTIDMLERTTAVLERDVAAVSGGSSFAQMRGANGVIHALQSLVAAEQMSVADGKKLTALIQAHDDQSDEEAAFGAPAASVHDSGTQIDGSVLDMLQGLLDQSQEQLDSARKAETQAKNNFDMKKQSLEDEIKYASADLDEAKKTAAASRESKASAEGDLAVTTKGLNEDKADLAGVHQECMTKASTYETEVTSRAEELKALATAKKIIVEATSGRSYGRGGGEFAQMDSFLQLKSSSKGQKLVHMLRALAKEEKDKSLAQLASRAESALRIGSATHEDVFDKIREMTNDMIAKLEEEQAADATQKVFCDKEMKETKAKKEDKSADVEKLSIKKDQKEAKSAKVKEEVVTLQKELTELAASQLQMNELRAEEKAAADAATPELKKGIKGLQLALKTLKDYYSKAADAAHGDNSGASNGIIALLETAETDFIRNLNEVVAEEQMAAAAYEQQTKENDLVKLAKEADVKYKTKEAASLDKYASDLATDLAGATEELDAVNSAWDTLQGQCIQMPDTYEERQQKRKDEVTRLEGTLQALKDQEEGAGAEPVAEEPAAAEEGAAPAEAAAAPAEEAAAPAEPAAAAEEAAAAPAEPAAAPEEAALVQVSANHLRGITKHA